MEFYPDWFVNRLEQFQNQHFHSFQKLVSREWPQSLILIEAPEKNGKTYLLRRMLDYCAELSPPIPVIYLDFRNRLIESVDDFQVVQLLGNSFEAPAFFQPLFAEVTKHGGVDAWLPTEAIKRLVDEILVSFNSEGQLKLLFRYVDANYDLLPGDGGLEKTYEFVAFCLRRNSLDQLLETLVHEREDRADSWRALIADIERAAAESTPALPTGGFAKLRASEQEREHIMKAVTAVFIACLEKYLGQLDRLVLLLDSYEECSFEAKKWLEIAFVPYLAEEVFKKHLILVVAGQRTMYVRQPAVRNLIVRVNVPAGTLSRLSPPVEMALRRAEALRSQFDLAHVTPELLLAGLFLNKGGATESLLTLRASQGEVLQQMERWLADFFTAGDVVLQAITPAPPSSLAQMRVTPELQQALQSAEEMTQAGRGMLEEHILLAALLKQPMNEAGRWLIAETGLVSDQLAWLGEQVGGGLDLASLSKEQISGLAHTYHPSLQLSKETLPVGARATLTLDLEPSRPVPGETISLTPDGLRAFLTIDAGLQLIGQDSITLVIDPQSGRPRPASFTVRAYLVGARSFQIELYDAEETGRSRQRYTSKGKLTVEIPVAESEVVSILPVIDVRVAPRPDFVLQVQAVEDAATIHLIYRLSSRLPGLMRREKEVGTVTLAPDDLARLQSAVINTAAEAAHLAPADADLRFRDLGRWLYDLLIPTATAAALRDDYWIAADRLTTWLILEDNVVWLPWELIAPYRPEERNDLVYFLGERHQIGRWLPGLGTTLYTEVPIGEVALSQYRHQSADEASRDRAVESFRALLQASTFYGIRGPLVADSPFYNLHLLRQLDSQDRWEIVPHGGRQEVGGSDSDVVHSRPNLYDKRPVVTMSMVGNTDTADGWLLPDRALPFLRAGASIVAGPWWPTSEAADRLFWGEFYESFLVHRRSIGEAMQRSRQVVHDLLPSSPDWLAYTLFADPRARPYTPERSQGYTAVQCLDVADPDQPLRAGRSYTFLATVQQRPPEWYEGRLVEAEALPEDLSVLFLATDLQEELPRPVRMETSGRNLHQATVILTPPASGTYPVLVQFMAGGEHLDTLQLMLNVEDA